MITAGARQLEPPGVQKLQERVKDLVRDILQRSCRPAVWLSVGVVVFKDLKQIGCASPTL